MRNTAHCTCGTQPHHRGSPHRRPHTSGADPATAALTCQPRSRKLTYSSCFLQACLWSLLLFSEERHRGEEKEIHTD